MIDTYLFLPDNLMAILYEEQRLIQTLLTIPFKTPFPMFKSSQEFSKLIIRPPIAVDGLIIRPSIENDKYFTPENSKTKSFTAGFILGDAKSEADLVIEKLNSLKAKSKKTVFSELTCKAWYYAEIDFKQAESDSACEWTVLSKKWVKEK